MSGSGVRGPEIPGRRAASPISSPLVKKLGGLVLSPLALIVCCSGLAACGDDGPRPIALSLTGEAPAQQPADVAPLNIASVVSIDNTFRPGIIEVPAGTEVVWVNRGRNEHDILSDFGFGVEAAAFHPGDEYRHVFTEPGEYPYYCTIHGTHAAGMVGTIIVV